MSMIHGFVTRVRWHLTFPEASILREIIQLDHKQTLFISVGKVHFDWLKGIDHSGFWMGDLHILPLKM